MTPRAGLRWMAVVAATVTVAVIAVAIGSPTPPPPTAPVGQTAAVGHIASGGRGGHVVALKRSTVAAELAVLHRAGVTLGAPSKAVLTDMMDAPGAPTCAPPPVPAATYPPDGSYGIPFLAEITDGQVLAGYDEWTANNLTWTVKGTTYTLYPWQSKIYDITGWVTGLLELPSLQATIPPQDIVFCDQGGASCLSADWPAGQCIHILAQYGPSPASPTPPPGLGNDHPEGTACSGYSTPTFNCFPYVVSLTPSSDTYLTVSGVEPDGALDLSVTTSAVTTVTEVPPSPSPTFTCQNDPTTVTLSTVAPTGLPATAPVAPEPPNTDDRYLQTPPLPLSGPLSSSTSTVASDNFSIPAFFPSAGGSPCSIFLATSLNTYAGGWNSIFKDQNQGLYYVDGGNGQDVVNPGWAQFTATTTVVTFGLPVGPPPGFTF